MLMATSHTVCSERFPLNQGAFILRHTNKILTGEYTNFHHARHIKAGRLEQTKVGDGEEQEAKGNSNVSCS